MDTPNYLHTKVRQSKREFPYSKFISNVEYPYQSDIVGTVIEIEYRLKDIGNQNYLTTRPTETHRPHDDVQTDYDPRDSQEFTEAYVTTGKFLVLRCDVVEPYKFVAISDDFLVVLVSDSRNYTDTKCNIVGKQNAPFIGYEVRAKYLDELPDEIAVHTDAIPMANFSEDNDNLTAYILSSDISEPGYDVIIQYMETENSYRVILSDECLFELIAPPTYSDPDPKWQLRERRRMIIEGRSPYVRRIPVSE